MPTSSQKKYVPTSKSALEKRIQKEMAQYGNACDLNFIDVSRMTDLSALFYGSHFNGDISRWDVSNVVDMDALFEGSRFNGDISRWDVSNVRTMQNMFMSSDFNGSIFAWNTRKVERVDVMFDNAAFMGDLSAWSLAENARISTFLSEKALQNMEKPCFYHWHVLQQNKAWMTKWIPDAIKVYYNEHAAMTQTLAKSPQEQATLLQAMWLKDHTKKVHNADTYFLSEVLLCPTP